MLLIVDLSCVPICAADHWMSIAGVIYSSGNAALLTNIFGDPP